MQRILYITINEHAVWFQVSAKLEWSFFSIVGSYILN